MKILVFGVGAIGTLLTHFLCEAGNDVTVVARSTYEELNKNGLVIRHYLQMKTTVDYPRVLKEPDDAHYDMVFSVMQGQQQLDLLPVLKSVDTDLIVLVGNNLETDKCEEALKDMNHLYGFQGSAGHREGGVTVAGRLPTTDLTVGRLDHAPLETDVRKLRKAFDVKGYKITPVDNMYAYYMYHIAEIMPYCYLSYHLDCDLKKATREQIKMVMAATGGCFDYLKELGIPVMPAGEDDYYDGGSKTTAMQLLYSIMSKTILGQLMVSDHCKNGIKEMKYLDGKFEEYRKDHPGRNMQVWDRMREWALPAFEIADNYMQDKSGQAKSKSGDYFDAHGDDEYEMTISDARWWSYDIPGNIGWIIWIVCTVKNLKKKVDVFSATSVIPGVLMITGVIELICERIQKLGRVLPRKRVIRGFGALTLGGILGIPISAAGIVKSEDRKRYTRMLAGSVLCSVFAGLCFRGYKKK